MLLCIFKMWKYFHEYVITQGPVTLIYLGTAVYLGV